MADSREAILGRLVGASHWVPADPELLPAEGASAAQPSAVALSESFVAEARRIDAEAYLEADKAGALSRLGDLLKGEQVLAWDLPFLPAAVAEAVRASGGAFLHQGDPGAAAAGLGLTGCDFAVAETGSIVVNAAPGRPRLASLIVRLHVALVDPSQIVPNLVSAFSKIQALSGQAAHVNLISGPSRTADIEMTLTRGVHGPKRLVVIVAPWFDL